MNATNPTEPQGIVVYAPPGAGKSTHAKALAQHFGKTRIVDEWTPGAPLRTDSIALTNVPVRGAVYLLDALDAAQVTLPAAYRTALVAARGRA